MEKNNSSWDPRKVAHLLVSLEVKFHSMSNADTKNTRNFSWFFSKLKEMPKLQKQTNKKHKHSPSSTIPLPQANKTPPKDPPNPKPEEISCKVILNKNAGSYETRSHHLVFILLYWLILYKIFSDISE